MNLNMKWFWQFLIAKKWGENNKISQDFILGSNFVAKNIEGWLKRFVLHILVYSKIFPRIPCHLGYKQKFLKILCHLGIFVCSLKKRQGTLWLLPHLRPLCFGNTPTLGHYPTTKMVGLWWHLNGPTILS